MKRIHRSNIFYVYEHWRQDTNVCFYVGKGKGKRAYSFDRVGKHYKNIIKRLKKLELRVEVRLVKSGLTERAAFDLEIARIAFWRASKVKLTNLTDGGEGASGVVHSELSKIKNSLAHTGRKNTKQTLELMRRSAIVTSAERAERLRKNHYKYISDQHRQQLILKNTGKTYSAEVNSKKGRKGRIASLETRKKMSKPKAPEQAAVLSARFIKFNKQRAGINLSELQILNMKLGHAIRKLKLVSVSLNKIGVAYA